MMVVTKITAMVLMMPDPLTLGIKHHFPVKNGGPRFSDLLRGLRTHPFTSVQAETYPLSFRG